MKAKHKLEKATFIANISYNLFLFQLTAGMTFLKTVFADINILFFTEVWYFCLFIFAFATLSISTHNACSWSSPNYLDNKANPNLDTSITKGQLPLIPFVRLSLKHFQLSNYPVPESCVACTHKIVQANINKYRETKILDICEKCNVYVCKSCFEQYNTCSQPKNK